MYYDIYKVIFGLQNFKLKKIIIYYLLTYRQITSVTNGHQGRLRTMKVLRIFIAYRKGY